MRDVCWQRRLNVVRLIIATTLTISFLVPVGCGYPTSSVCSEYLGRWSAIYTGAFSGYGVIELSSSSTLNQEKFIARIALLPGPPKDANVDAILNLEGMATCTASKLVINFGADPGSSDEFKILGGSLVGLLDAKPEANPFGAWRMHLIQLSSLQEREVSGYWRITGKISDDSGA